MKRLLTLIMLLALLPGAAPAQQKAKYIFYFIGDGMGMGHINTTEAYNRMVLGNTDPILMLRFPYGGQVRTHSANKPITDSAAAGTALATGEKTNNYMVGVTPDSLPVTSIAYALSRNGYRVGIGSSVFGDDATPSAFYANAHNRSMRRMIAPQIAKSHFSFFGFPMLKGSLDSLGNPDAAWYRLMRDTRFTITHNADSLTSLSEVPYKAILLADKPYGAQVGYTIDSLPDALTLQQITLAALNQVYHRTDSLHPGFFIMIEGGNIDWAAHANDGGAVIKEILNFQKSIDIAYQFYLSHPDETLIVVTADHDTGGMALGRRDNNTPNLSLADFQRISKDRFSDYCKERYADGKAFTWPMMRDFLKQNLGFWGAVSITVKQEKSLRESFEKVFHKRKGRDQKTLYNDFNQYAVEVFDLFNSKLGIGWISNSHTANPVPVYAIGVGAQEFGHNIDNTQIPMLILKAAGVEKPKKFQKISF